MAAMVKTRQDQAEAIENVLVVGNLAALSTEERLSYYQRVCSSLGLNPWTRPFEYITLQGKMVLYARKDATEQLRKLNRVSITRLEHHAEEGVYIVTAYARTADGREDSSVGAVPIENLKGEARANAMMKAETKAKRRVTLSICGLGMLDETEIASIPDARPVHIDTATGEIVDAPAATQTPRLLDAPGVDIPDDIQKASRETLLDMWDQQNDEASGLKLTLEYVNIPKGWKAPQVREELARRRARINAEFERQRQQAVADTVPNYEGGTEGETETPF